MSKYAVNDANIQFNVEKYRPGYSFNQMKFKGMIGAVNIQFNLDDYYNRIQKLLPSDSILKAEKYHFTDDKKRSLAGEFLKRVLISNSLKTRASDLHFITNEFNKPSVANLESIHFNLTHSGDWVVIAIDDQPVGIDIEKIQPKIPDVEKIAFTQEEIQQIYQIESQQLTTRFFKQWTRKESYIKALGIGFSASLDKISILELSNGEIQIFTDHYDKTWIIRDLIFDSGYSLSVCSKKKLMDNVVRFDFSYLVDNYL